MLQTLIAALSGVTLAANVATGLKPLVLHGGLNAVSNIAGDGSDGSISFDWRENGNAWGYSVITVMAGGSIAAVEGKYHFTARPHTGEDVITAVRFARGVDRGRPTTFALVADRTIAESVPAAAVTIIKLYALRRNSDPIGTPYRFEKIDERHPARRYCHADMAITSELGLALPRDYGGPRTLDGC